MKVQYLMILDSKFEVSSSTRMALREILKMRLGILENIRRLDDKNIRRLEYTIYQCLMPNWKSLGQIVWL